MDGRPVDDLKFTKAAMLLTFEDHVDLALRHGVAAPRGLLLDHGFVAQVLAPANLKAQRANQDAIAEQLAVVERRTEDVGSLRSHRHAAAYEGADQDLERRITKAEEAARETLQAAPDEDRPPLDAPGRRGAGHAPGRPRPLTRRPPSSWWLPWTAAQAAASQTFRRFRGPICSRIIWLTGRNVWLGAPRRSRARSLPPRNPAPAQGVGFRAS